MSSLPSKLKGKAKAISTGSILRPEDVAKSRAGTKISKRSLALNPSTSASSLVKKPRLDFSATPLPSKLGLSSTSSTLTVGQLKPPLDWTWKDFCQNTTVDIATFNEAVTQSLQQDKVNKAARLITSALRLFLEKKADSSKFSMEYHFVTIISLIVKEHGKRLTNLNLQKCLSCLICIMKPFSIERQEIISSLFVCLLEQQTVFDSYLLTVFLHDSLGDRNWIEKSFCSKIVCWCIKPFDTVFPTKDMYTACNAELAIPDSVPDLSVENKFFTETVNLETIQEFVLEVLRKWWEKGNESPGRNLLKTMSLLSGISEVRLAAAKRLDNWVLNGKLQRHALELLLFVGCNIGDVEECPMDFETLSFLLKMRSFKSKQVQSVFQVAIREVLTRSERNLRGIIRIIIANEFGPSQLRAPCNMSILSYLFSLDNRKTTIAFSIELSASVRSREELAKPARLFTREILRAFLRLDFNFPLFTENYLNSILEDVTEESRELQERAVISAPEVLTMAPIVLISICLKDVFAARRNGSTLSPEQVNTIMKYEKDLLEYFEICLRFLHKVKSKFSSYRNMYSALLRFLYLEKVEYYTTMDQGPSDFEFTQGMKVISECSLADKVLWLVVGQDSALLQQQDAIDIIYELTKRAMIFRPSHDSRKAVVLFASSVGPLKLVERVLDVCLYLPGATVADYKPMYLNELYWKSWIILILWTCVGKVGEAFSSVYETFPIFRMFVHMILTKDFHFPLAFEGLTREEVRDSENQISVRERKTILTQEKLLEDAKQGGAAQEINEETSLLLYKCSLVTAKDVVRRPPESILQDLEVISTECQLAATLCECREPDLLSNLIKMSGATKAMSAIQDLLVSNAKAINHLPPVILSQFFIYHLSLDKRMKKLDSSIEALIISQLRMAIKQDTEGKCLQFLVNGLASEHSATRTAASAALSLLTDAENETLSFSYDELANYSSFPKVKKAVCNSLADSIRFEFEPKRVEELLDFILKHMNEEDVHEILASVCLSFDKTVSSVLPLFVNLFLRYHKICMEHPDSYPEDLAVGKKYRVSVGEIKVSMNSLVIESSVLLLCKTAREISGREDLMNFWFPDNGQTPHVLNEEAEVQIFDSHIQAPMLCSSDQRIVQIALNRISSVDALRLISSFGLTVYSASQLLKIIDNIDTTMVKEKDCLAIRPFIIAYKRRGAEGGDKILSKLEAFKSESRQEEQKFSLKSSELSMEVDETNINAVHDLKESEIEALIVNMTIDHSKDQTFPTSVLALVQSSPSAAKTLLQLIEKYKSQLIAESKSFNDVLYMALLISQKHPDLKTECFLLIRQILVQKHSTAHMEEFMAKFNSDNSTKSTQINLNADEILKVLNFGEEMTHMERSKYLNTYLVQKPEIIARNDRSEDVESQLLSIFSATNGAECLVPHLSLRSPLETQERILNILLSSLNPRYNPSLVYEFVQSCISEEFKTFFTPAKISVLSEYIVVLSLQSAEHMAKGVDLINKMVDTFDFDILLPVVQVILDLKAKEKSVERVEKLSQLYQNVEKLFPCLHVCQITNRVSFRGKRWRLDNLVKSITSLTNTVIESKDNEETELALDILNQELNNYPTLMIRELADFFTSINNPKITSKIGSTLNRLLS
ncbi:unnamed protein product [Auanema sp. JU1783]|nr:unnamed protein product [Auanema sp. JU1783]